MVQLSPFGTLDVSLLSERSEEEAETPKDPVTGSGTNADPPSELSPLPLSFEVSTVYYGYESYIEDGLICLKHKVRNMEKRKLKLEDYKKRLMRGDALNKDQLVAVEKYDELLHNLAFARELHKALDSLTLNLLGAQKKAVKKEQLAKVEVDRKRLSKVLQFQYLLSSLQQEHIRRDLLTGSNKAPKISAQQLHNLSQLAALLGVKRNNSLSLEAQMDQAALVYMDLLEAKDEPVVGSTFKLVNEELTMMLANKYFSCLPPPANSIPEAPQSSAALSTITKSNTNEVPKEFFNRLYRTVTEAPPIQNWKEEFRLMKECEPPDYWDMESAGGQASPQRTVHKPWRGAATLIPKVSVATKKPVSSRLRKERKSKDNSLKLALDLDIPVEVFSSPLALPKDPVLRKQHLEDLMAKIHGSFTFMQDSLLDGESSPQSNHAVRNRRASGPPSPLAQTEVKHPLDIPPKVMHSTPLPARHSEHRASLTNGDLSMETSDLPAKHLVTSTNVLSLQELLQFPSPPLYRRGESVSHMDKVVCMTQVSDPGKQSPYTRAAVSTPPPGQSFSAPPSRRTITSAPLKNTQSNGELKQEPGSRYSTASTQTPSEFEASDDEQQPVYHDHMVGNGQVFLSPGRSGPVARSGQPYYTRACVRGMARGGKGLARAYRSPGWHRGGTFIPQTHPRDSGPLHYPSRDLGFQHSYRHGGRQNSSLAWSDSSQVSSPDREGTYTMVDSGHGDSLSVSPVEVPLTPHGHQHAALMPVQLYPLSQPLRVAFTASRTANFAPGNLDQPIVFDQLHTNLGEMYDTHIGRFTCPVNGTYVFFFHILKLAINVPLYINLMRNEDVMVSAYANDGAPDHETASNHAILPLFQGDQVWLRLHRGAIYGSTWKYSTFSGFLLYPD
ncbi:caprin-2 [Thalassophryne amazonica]|uniref:caprin-2 n=1 Tax=Thalassophryne amazonica TaxID=390379 RepID=UPI00147121D9|nr:caprin-2 [Thalassophryne amazonica]